MVTLCGFRLSNYYNKVRIVLLEKGIAHKEEPNYYPSQDEAFRQRSPMGKAPFLETPHGVICESATICEYLEDAFPDKPLLPAAPFARAKVREFLQVLELHVELVARRLYPELVANQKVAEEVKKDAARDLEKGIHALAQLAQFGPYAVGAEFTLADCAAVIHLPLVSLVTRSVLGRDYLEVMPQLKEYLKLVNERPAVKQVNDDRRAAVAARTGQKPAK